MNTWKKTLFGAIAAILLAFPASAAVLKFDISIPTSGTPDPWVASFTIDNPFDADVINTTAGLTVNSLPTGYDDAKFNFSVNKDQLFVGNQINPAVNSAPFDWGVAIFRVLSEPVLGVAFIRDDEEKAIVFPSGQNLNDNATLTVTELAPVPLPASGALLLFGLCGAGLAARVARNGRARA